MKLEICMTAFETRIIARLDSMESRLNALLDNGETPIVDLGE